jgi:hypothetical protein
VPATLLHPVFNEFIDDCNNYCLTKEDSKLVVKLSFKMACLHQLENICQTKFVLILDEYSLKLSDSHIGDSRCTTDSNICISEHLTLLVKFKNEMGSKGAEPVFQSAIYYIRQLKYLEIWKGLNIHSPYPCIVMYMIGLLFLFCLVVSYFMQHTSSGPMFSFVGLTFNTHVNIQVLGQPMQLDYHPTDTVLCTKTVQYFGTLKCVVHKLKHYYKVELPDIDPLDTRQLCYVQYTDLINSTKCCISYSPYPDNLPRASKLFFFSVAKVDRADWANPIHICVKFVTRYSKEAHQKCADMGITLALRGFEHLPGRWFMVVMDQIDNEYINMVAPFAVRLHNQIFNKVVNLHQASYMHGDLQDMNIMVRKDNGAEFVLVDFDWAGQIEEVTYPININLKVDCHDGSKVYHPGGVGGGKIIQAEHDIAMLEILFPP